MLDMLASACAIHKEPCVVFLNSEDVNKELVPKGGRHRTTYNLRNKLSGRILLMMLMLQKKIRNPEIASGEDFKGWSKHIIRNDVNVNFAILGSLVGPEFLKSVLTCAKEDMGRYTISWISQPGEKLIRFFWAKYVIHVLSLSPTWTDSDCSSPTPKQLKALDEVFMEALHGTIRTPEQIGSSLPYDIIYGSTFKTLLEYLQMDDEIDLKPMSSQRAFVNFLIPPYAILRRWRVKDLFPNIVCSDVIFNRNPEYTSGHKRVLGSGADNDEFYTLTRTRMKKVLDKKTDGCADRDKCIEIFVDTLARFEIYSGHGLMQLINGAKSGYSTRTLQLAKTNVHVFAYHFTKYFAPEIKLFTEIVIF